MQPYVELAFISRGLDPVFDPPPPCEVCESKRADDVDHIRGRRAGLMKDPTNLMFVCRECHTYKGDYEEKLRRQEIVIDKLVYPYSDPLCLKK